MSGHDRASGRPGAWRRRRTAILAAAAIGAALVGAGPASGQGDGPSTTAAPTTATTVEPSATTSTTSVPAEPSIPRIRLQSQTPWVQPGGELRLAVMTTGVDPAAVDVTVSVYPRVTNRADLSASFTGDGLRSALWQLPSGPVHLVDLPASADGSRTLTVPTRSPDAPLDRSRARVEAGIYPVEVQLLSTRSGDVVDRFVTHLLAPDAPKDGSRLGVVTVLPISARPTVATDGTRTGPPEGTATIAAVAAGLTSVPGVPVTAVVSPETLEALEAAAPSTAAAIGAALADHPVVARPYVPLRVPALGDAAGAVLPQELEAGTAVATAVLGRPPTSTAWIADEPLDTDAAGELASIGITQLVVSGRDLAPPAAAPRSQPPTQAVPRQPVPVAVGSGRSLRALVADPALAAHTDPGTAPADQPLAAHHLLTELAGVALLPPTKGASPAPPASLAGTVATVLPPRSWRPTQAFLTALLAGIAQSPILQGLDPAAAFAVPSAAPAPSTSSTSGGRRSTTTTTPPNERSLQRLPAADTRLGGALTRTRATLAAHTSVLPDLVQPGVAADRQVLVAASADLDADEQLRRLAALERGLEADLERIRIPGGRDLRLTSRAGDLPIGIVNDVPSEAHVLLRVSSEKLEFPDGPDRVVTLGRQNTTQQVRVLAKTAGAFPLRVELRSPDGSRVLDTAEYRVRSNSLPGVGIAVSVAAGLVLAFWWGKTLLFQPRGAHARERT